MGIMGRNGSRIGKEGKNRMPFYEYRCTSCYQKFETMTRGESLPCRSCGEPAKRLYSFTFKEPLQEHYNIATGQYVSNETDLKNQFKVISETASERTGIEHNFVPTSPDMASNGVTDEGLQSTYNRMSPEGRKKLDKYL